jgi:hypothetical protein
MIDALVNQPQTSLIAFGIAAAGIPFYFIWRAKTPALRAGPLPQTSSQSRGDR